MPGLFGTLGLGSRALQTHQRGVETAGQNLANVNNPAYARQRLELTTSAAIETESGIVGTGVEAVTITQVRSRLLDQQAQTEASLTAMLEAQQNALQYAQDDLGETLDSSSASDSSTVGSVGGIADNLTSLFNAFQDLSTSPDSIPARQAVLVQAEQLASRLNVANQRLSTLNGQLNETVSTDVASANQLLSEIASLNQQISVAEGGGDTANDLRDLRQQKLETLAKLVNIQTADSETGVNVSVDGQLLVDGRTVQETLETYDSGGGQVQVRGASSGLPFSVTGGSVGGTIEARDSAVKAIHDGLNTLAAQLIAKVNDVHSTGYSLKGGTGTAFFTGADASDIAVNADLLGDPTLLQASGSPSAMGDNQTALALAQLASTEQADLNDQTFLGNYRTLASELGARLASVSSQLSDQQVVQNALETRRASVSGVSLDEEMTDMVKYQKAYQASAHLVSVVNEMLDQLLRM